MKDASWAAGLFEGEGCVARMNKHGVRLSLWQSGEHRHALLERFRAAVGCGTVYEIARTRTNPNHSDASQWALTRRDDVAHVMNTLSPFLTPGCPKLLRYQELSQ